MGGFSPPVPTPATTDSGIRTQELLETATSLVRDVDPEVLFEYPNDSILTVITEKIKKTDSCKNRKAEWPYVPKYPMDLTISAAATAAATQVVLGANEYQRLHRGMQLMVNRTGEVFTVGGAAEPSSATIDIIGRTGAQAVVAGDTLRIIGVAMEEVADKPAIRTQRETYDYNYTQQFYVTWGVSLRDKNAKSYLGSELAMERRKAMQRYNLYREQVAIFGLRARHASIGFANSTELQYAGGARQFSQSNVWDLTGNRPTEDQFLDFLGELFAHGEGGYSASAGMARKLGLLSPAWFRLVEEWFKNKVVYDNITDEKRRLGVKVGVIQTSVGDVMLALHPLFAEAPYRDKSLWLDLNQIKMANHDGIGTTVLENIQTPGRTAVEHGVICDTTWKWMGDERAHGWIEGLGLATS